MAFAVPDPVEDLAGRHRAPSMCITPWWRYRLRAVVAVSRPSEDAVHLGYEVRIHGGLPGRGGLPRDTAGTQDSLQCLPADRRDRAPAKEAPVPALDHLAAVRAVGSGTRRLSRSADVPAPLASILDHLDELGEVPEFVSAAELAEALEFDAARLGRRLVELGCQSTRERVTSESGKVRQIRGYLTADLFAAAEGTGSSDGEL